MLPAKQVMPHAFLYAQCESLEVTVFGAVPMSFLSAKAGREEFSCIAVIAAAAVINLSLQSWANGKCGEFVLTLAEAGDRRSEESSTGAQQWRVQNCSGER